MKPSYLFLFILLSLSAAAQETLKTVQESKARPVDNIQEEQEAMDESTVNEFDVGPYDRQGEYLNYSRLQEEMEAAKEGKTMDEE